MRSMQNWCAASGVCWSRGFLCGLWVQMMEDAKISAMPVVDAAGQLVGLVTLHALVSAGL